MIKLPSPGEPKERKTLSYSVKTVSEKGFSFSFANFDRTHELFNLGANTKTGTVSANWFIDLLDCFKSVNGMTIPELKASMHDLHPADWKSANPTPPPNSEQFEYWQFRLNKSSGRVIGMMIEGVFYVVWLDPHHNFTNSEGYGKERYYKPAKSTFELMQDEISEKTKKIQELEADIAEAYKLLDEKTAPETKKRS